eukprot:582005-Amorphochlora_amoeboformis.AAC.1
MCRHTHFVVREQSARLIVDEKSQRSRRPAAGVVMDTSGCLDCLESVIGNDDNRCKPACLRRYTRPSYQNPGTL